MFEHLIQYLRNGREWVEFDSEQESQHFKNELKFWGVETPKTPIVRELVSLMNSEPDISPEFLKKWRKVGPVDIYSWINSKIVPFDDKVPLQVMKDDTEYRHG